MILKLIGGPLDGQEVQREIAALIMWLFSDESERTIAEYALDKSVSGERVGVPIRFYNFTGRTEAAHS